MYTIIALVGQAGSGKDTLMRRVVDMVGADRIHEIVSCTTRPPREGEVDGKNYFFLTGEEYADKVLNGEMLEGTCFNDWFYGTAYESLDENKINIGVFNPAGIDSLKQHQGVRPIVFFISASDRNRLIRQLSREQHPDINEIFRRYKADMIDFEDFINEGDYYELENDEPVDLDYLTVWLSNYINELAE